ncbi:MAG TPA: DUF2087 domain-containing protein, partial [Acidimicrobiales bacterium]|nr:DUF2087 domain-containing protein [Acidimicrobiales bacterium]
MPGVPDPSALAGLLAEDARLRAFAAIVLGARTPAEVADASGLTPRDVMRAAAGAAAAATRRPVDPKALGATPEQADVLRQFLSDDGRLTRIPSARAKRLVVLDFLAQQFEPGRSYPERDVNLMLGEFHRDYAALRRYLVHRPLNRSRNAGAGHDGLSVTRSGGGQRRRRRGWSSGTSTMAMRTPSGSSIHISCRPHGMRFGSCSTGTPLACS